MGIQNAKRCGVFLLAEGTSIAGIAGGKRRTGPTAGLENGHMAPFNGGQGRTMEIEIDSSGANVEAQSDLTISDYGDEDESGLDKSGTSSKMANRRHSLPLVLEEEGSDEDDGEEKKEDFSPPGVLSSRENLHWQISDNGSIISKGSLKKPVGYSSNRDEYTFKFSYEPRELEREYYRLLFQHAKVEKQSDILPPKEAAQLFLTSGIQSDRLRMIWNMAVLPAPKSAKDTPPPSMAKEQFNVAVRLIQLFQNRVTAKDDQLNVSDNTMMAPPFFSGISGVQVALPWNDLDQSEDSGATVTRRASNATANFSTNATTSNSDGDTSAEGGKQPQRRHSIESTDSGSHMVPAQPKSVTASISSTDQDKIFRMEQDIQMLKNQVKSLQLEVKSLREMRQPEQTRQANRQQPGASGAVAPTSTVLSSFTSEYSDDDDKPTTDVEMYWGEGDRTARSRPTEAPAESMTSPMRQAPPSAMKTNPTYQTNAPRPLQSTHVRTPRRNIEEMARNRNFSRNIPRFHSSSHIQTYSNQSQRSLAQNPSRGQHQVAHPQSRAPASNQLRASLPVNGNVSQQIPEHRKSTATAPAGRMPMRSRRLSTESSFTAASSRTMSTHLSMFSAPNYPYRDPFPDSRRSGDESASLASQLDNVNRQEQLNNLLRQTRQARARRPSTDSSVQSFVPAQLNRGPSVRRIGRPLQKNSLIQSARHIYRRSGGETEIYQEEFRPSTRAVDLKPL